ncbi:hypothetical protein [Specibacter cremeus]|uniref:hypothetical protein n=1 Tax=Specibacter cremeus TaxID=1629051 RepID=UPI000F7A9237|nr:hypothetical protein [Specibacter cremeus]
MSGTRADGSGAARPARGRDHNRDHSNGQGNGLRRGQFALAMILLAQYLLGLAVNLFVTIPDSHPGARPDEYFSGVTRSVGWAITGGGMWLALHAIVGLLVTVIAIWLAVLAVKEHRTRTLTILGAVFVLAAGFNGGSFLNYNQDFSSLLMGGLWALALACYLITVFAGREAVKHPKSRQYVM